MRHDHEYHSLTVRDVVIETGDARTFVLEVPTDLDATFAYRPGQFCTFRAVVAGEEVARSYSMSSCPDVGDALAVTVKRVPGGKLSNWMIDNLAPGSSIDVLGPAGLFTLRDTEVPIVAFAGGSGITPVFSIIKSALASTTRAITLVYANRDADSVIFGDQLDALASASGGRLRVHAHLDADRGFLTSVECAALVEPERHGDMYVCGPGPFMDTVEAALESLGVNRQQVFIERFALPGETAPTAESSATETLVIRHQRQKRSTEYHLGETILESARRAGLAPPFSCESGSCATCMALVEKGAATMRVNNALTPDEVEEGWVLTCQALPSTREVVVNYDA